MTIPLIHAPIMSNFACAVNANGTLKSAADIEWFNDVDDDAPMAPVSTQPAQSTSALSLSQGNLDGFLHLTNSGKAPAQIVAGSRRSGRAIKPTAKVRDAALTLIPAKRPATSSMATSAPKRTLAVVDDFSDDMFEEPEERDVNEEMPDLVEKSDSEDEDAREEYERNQAMADTDCDVSSPLFYF